MRRSVLVLYCTFLAAALTCAAEAEAAPRAHGARTTKPRAAASPAKKAEAKAPLTSESLGLGDIKLRSIKEGEAETPPPSPPPAPPPPTPSVDVGPPRDRVIEPRAEPRRRFTIGVNPLPVIAGRYGMNLEVVPFVHHAFIASAFYQTFTPRVLEVLMPSVVDTSRGADAKIGGELGYRFYSGRTGAHGLFLGASGVAMPLALPRLTADFRSEVVSFHAFGGALDVGVQAITSWGFTIGGGLGVMYLAYDEPKSATPPPGAPSVNMTAPHILPRLLLSAGWSF